MGGDLGQLGLGLARLAGLDQALGRRERRGFLLELLVAVGLPDLVAGHAEDDGDNARDRVFPIGPPQPGILFPAQILIDFLDEKIARGVLIVYAQLVLVS